MIKFLLLLIAPALLATTLHASEAQPLAEDPVVEQRLINIAEELRCLVCQNESLAASRAELAQDLRREVRELIKSGNSDQQVRDFLVSRYGDFVLYRPQLKPSTYLLWIGPFVLLLIAVFFLLRHLRRRQGVTTAPLSEEERRRAEELLKADPS